MDRALLVSHQDVADLILLKKGVVDRQHRPARIAENMLGPLVGERLDHHFGAGHLCHWVTLLVSTRLSSWSTIFSENRAPLLGAASWAVRESKRGPKAPVRIATIAGGSTAPGDALP